MIKVVKFGGSSLADAAQFQKAGQIIRKVPESELLNVLREELLNWEK